MPIRLGSLLDAVQFGSDFLARRRLSIGFKAASQRLEKNVR
jgi:hypothetical protein